MQQADQHIPPHITYQPASRCTAAAPITRPRRPRNLDGSGLGAAGTQLNNRRTPHA